jgi:hypothetical protein
MSQIIEFIVLTIIIVTLSLLVEKALHMSYSLKQVVYQLKTDVKNIPL